MLFQNSIKILYPDILFQLRSEFNLLLMNLIVGELLVVVLGHPFDTIAAFQRGWFMGDTVCTAVGFVLTMLGTSDFC